MFRIQDCHIFIGSFKNSRSGNFCLSVRHFVSSLIRGLNFKLSDSDLQAVLSALSYISIALSAYFVGQTEPKILRLVKVCVRGGFMKCYEKKCTVVVC